MLIRAKSLRDQRPNYRRGRPFGKPEKPDELEQYRPHAHACKWCMKVWPCPSAPRHGRCVAEARIRRHGCVCLECVKSHERAPDIGSMILGPI